MKQIFKKVSSLCTVLLMMAVLTLTGVSSVWAADEVDDTVKQTLVTTAEGLTDTIIALSDEDIENYTKSSDEFTVGAMTAWAGSKDEVGALKERTGETEASDDGYTVTVPVSFEKADANFVYIFDASTGAPTSLTVDVQYSMAETLRRAVMNTIMGIAIVFIVLIFLSFLIYLFRFIPNPEAKKKAQAAAAPAPAPVAAPVEAAEADDTELIAVIAAAIAAAEETTTDGFVVRSIKRRPSNKWNS